LLVFFFVFQEIVVRFEHVWNKHKTEKSLTLQNHFTSSSLFHTPCVLSHSLYPHPDIWDTDKSWYCYCTL